MPHDELSDFEKRQIAIGAGLALGGIGGIERSNKEILKAIKNLKHGDDPIKKKYKLLVMNGQQLVYQCPACRHDMIFPPELGGESANCVHCEAHGLLYTREDALQRAQEEEQRRIQAAIEAARPLNGAQITVIGLIVLVLIAIVAGIGLLIYAIWKHVLVF